jgi:hypothetical protein
VLPNRKDIGEGMSQQILDGWLCKHLEVGLPAHLVKLIVLQRFILPTVMAGKELCVIRVIIEAFEYPIEQADGKAQYPHIVEQFVIEEDVGEHNDELLEGTRQHETVGLLNVP